MADPMGHTTRQPTLAAIALAVLNAPTFADEIHARINAASGGDTVIVHPGLYVEPIDFRHKEITVRSLDPENPTIVATTIIEAPKDDYLTLVTITYGTLSGFTIRGAYYYYEFSEGEFAAGITAGLVPKVKLAIRERATVAVP